MLFAQVEQAGKIFQETATTYGFGVAVLIAVIVVGALIAWKTISVLKELGKDLGGRIVTAMENYLKETASAHVKTADAVNEIKIALPTICRADCPPDCENFRPKRKTG